MFPFQAYSSAMSSRTQHFNRTAIDAMEKRFRVKLINSLPGCKSLNLIGSVSTDGRTNLAIVSTVTHMGSSPPLLGYVSRPASVDRHTLTNIIDTGKYTINQVASSFYRKAHQTSARYPAEVSEFEAVGLTPEWCEGISVPAVAEAVVSTHMRLVDTVEIKVNGTVLVIGEVEDVFISDYLLEDDGNIDLEQAESVAGSGLDGYFKLEKLARLSYAKPDRPIELI